ncbi:MAG TPA: right-handed parallel beta-helix repeat-containing protein [Caulifigura sp.]|nr:right-handed parallel beta-helix repeat-containing protein [Caulifigura sp.]
MAIGDAFALVEDYGAVGNGVTDDTLAIRAAIASGKTVVLTPGKVYLTSATLTLQANQILEGNRATLKRAAQLATTTSTAITAGVTSTITVASAAGFYVGQDIVVENGGVYQTSPRRISAIAGNNITISGTFSISAAGTTNVYTSFYHLTGGIAGNPGGNRILNVRFDGNKANWTFFRWEIATEISLFGDASVVSGCEFFDVPGEGMVAFGSYHTISDCRFNNVNGNAIHFSGGNHTVVDACTIVGTNKDVSVGHVSGCLSWSNLCGLATISNCYMEDGRGGCISLSDLPDSEVRIVNNVFKNMTTAGVQLSAAATDQAAGNSVISGNYFIGSALGVEVMTGFNPPTVPPGNVSIANNNFVGQSVNAILVTRAANLSIVGNTIDQRGVNNVAVRITGRNVVLSANSIRGGTYGVIVESTWTKSVLVDANSVKEQTTGGIRFSDGVVDCTASNNTVENDPATTLNNYVGIQVGSPNAVAGNFVRLDSNGGAITGVRGILVVSPVATSQGIVCQLNTVRGSGQYGIRTDGGSGKAVLQFNVTTSGAPISVGGGTVVTPAAATYIGTISGGQLQSGTGKVNVSAAGSGYSGTITVVFVEGSNASASGTAVLSGGGISDVNITNVGSGYVSTPSVVIGGNYVQGNVSLP